MSKIVLIGAGNMAREHLRVIRALQDVDVVGIFSRTSSRAKALASEFDIGFVASSIAELYETTRADGVVIAVSEPATEAICLEALKHPWQILVEKPIGLSLDETKRISDAANGMEASFYVAMNRRNYSSTRMALEEVGKIQGKRAVQIFDQEDPLSALNGGRLKQVCDQWHFANSIHLIDLFGVFCRGAPIEVNNVVPWRPGYMAKSTHSVISFDSGDIGIYHSVWNAPGPWSVVIETAKKRFEMRPIESCAVQTYPSRNSELLQLVEEYNGFKPGLFMQMREFLQALKGNTNNMVTLRTYLESVRLTDELYRE